MAYFLEKIRLFNENEHIHELYKLFWIIKNIMQNDFFEYFFPLSYIFSKLSQS